PEVEIQADTKAIVVKAKHDAGIARIDLYESGKRVAQNTGADELTLPSPGAAGDSLDLLAVAVANNTMVDRRGWPEPLQSPQPDVQGWLAEKVVLADPITPAGSGGAGRAGTGGAGGGAGGSDTGGAGGGQAGSGAGGETFDGDCGCRVAGAGSESASLDSRRGGPREGGVGSLALAAIAGLVARIAARRRAT